MEQIIMIICSICYMLSFIYVIYKFYMCIGLAMSAMWQKTTFHREATVARTLTNCAALICWSTAEKAEKCLLRKKQDPCYNIRTSWYILKYNAK